MFNYRHDELYCEHVPLTAVAAQISTPVYVYSRSQLKENSAAYLQTAVSNTLVCYAAKANGNPHLLRLLEEWGMGADVTSGGELYLALHAGISPQKIIFSGVGKRRDEIEMAIEAGVRALHAESAMELQAIGASAANMQTAVNIGIRINPNIQANTHPHISTGAQTHKFGVALPAAREMFRYADNHPWLNPVGLAAHIGSQINDIPPFVESAQLLVDVAGDLATAGIRLEYLDVGGGFGINYTSDGWAQPSPIADWLTAVSTPIHAAGYDLVVEPGRSIIGTAGMLLTQVVYTKNQNNKRFIIADAGMNDLLRPSLYAAHHPILPVVRQSGSPRNGVDIVGPVCETGDFLGRNRTLPPVNAGEYLAVMQAGAYGFSMASNYNGRLKPAEVLVNGDQFRVIRHRQSYARLLDNVPR